MSLFSSAISTTHDQIPAKLITFPSASLADHPHAFIITVSILS